MAIDKDYLLLFLEKRLFVLGTADDDLLEKLRASVDAVVAVMEGDLNVVIPFSLVALDPETPPNDPVFETVASAVQNEWNTYTEQFADVPRTVFRAILLTAILRLAEKNVEVAGAVDLLCRNLLTSVQAGGEAPILEDFAKKVFRLAQDEADEHWRTELNDSTSKVPVIKLGTLSARGGKVDRDQLRAGFEVGNWPQLNWQNKPDALYSQLTSQGVERIAASIESAVKGSGFLAEDLKKNIVDPLQHGLRELLDSCLQITMATQAPILILRRQIDLIWWKEASFSETLQESYRLVPRSLVALTFAIDFASLVPAWCPQAVERFLAQTIWTLLASDVSEAVAPKLQLGGYLESVRSDKKTPTILNRLPAHTDSSKGRSTLISFVSDFVNGKTELANLGPRTGLEPTLSVDEPDVCLRLFREIQALRLLSDDQNGAPE